MAFNVLTIREAADEGSDLMYPVVGDTSLVRLDQADGSSVDRIVATAVDCRELVGDSLRSLLRTRDVKVEVFITDTRVAIACEKYDKGGGWIGGGTALAFNAISHARAALRRRGKVLVGQVRYPWLGAVGFMSKTGWLSAEAIRLHLNDGTVNPTRVLLLDLTLPKNLDAGAVAQDIARRAAGYRLRFDTSLKDGEREKFEAMATVARLSAPAPKQFAMYTMPTYFNAKPSTAMVAVAVG